LIIVKYTAIEVLDNDLKRLVAADPVVDAGYGGLAEK
jgi:hypothetical protein